MYPKSTRTRALRILMRQIARRSTTNLLQALSLWPVVESKLLLSEVLSWFDPIRASRGTEDEYENAILPAYRNHLSDWEDHSLAPIIDFFRAVASSTEQGWSTILDCGCLDLLLHLYVADFQDPVTLNSRTRSFSKSCISATCNSFLMEVLADGYGHRVVELHPLRGLWPPWPMLAFGSNTQNRCSRRRGMWKLVGKEQIQWRISSIYDALVMEWSLHGISGRAQTTLTTEPFLCDPFIDLLEFSGSSNLDEEICFRALRSMHKLWSRINTVEVNSRLRMYIEETPEDYAREIFIQLIHRLLLLSDILQLLDKTTTRLLACEALSLEGVVNVDPEDSFPHLNFCGTSQGPHYRMLVLSMMWDLLWKGPDGIASSIHNPHDELTWSRILVQNSDSLCELQILFPKQQHDNWADEWLNPSTYRIKASDHNINVYSWINNKGQASMGSRSDVG
ncbi:hypothetical protein GYMLUDRAFT_59119 [Collybiopsis luxurians FD-317 M1]|uniref:Uncharacterized protein n=1 Tax=Collybiopsis luxurians FD-317 M1 TaxID=944289 RepID=A0A0D0BBR4_9AGAR|nr:hypothetical protein GYMLUDRAFT_59119 [Collybiopsis luxurians FD-317 M1]